MSLLLVFLPADSGSWNEEITLPSPRGNIIPAQLLCKDATKMCINIALPEKRFSSQLTITSKCR